MDPPEASPAAPKPSRFKSMKVVSEAWERVREMRDYLIDRGAERLPEPYRSRWHGATRDAADRHKTIGMSAVIDLALDALDDALGEDRDGPR